MLRAYRPRRIGRIGAANGALCAVGYTRVSGAGLPVLEVPVSVPSDEFTGTDSCLEVRTAWRTPRGNVGPSYLSAGGATFIPARCRRVRTLPAVELLRACLACPARAPGLRTRGETT